MNQPEENLDLSGIPCPANAARALLAIEGLDPGTLLRISLDDGEPIANVPPALEEQGHTVMERTRQGQGWRVLVRRGLQP